MFDIANSVAPTAEEITYFLHQVKSRINSQLNNGISRALQKLLMYFYGTCISAIWLNFPKFLNKYDCILVIYRLVLRYLYLLHDLFEYYLYYLYIQ